MQYKSVYSCEAFFIEFCKELQFRPDLIRSHRRGAYILKPRYEIARRLREMGYSLPTIGKVMNRDHSTIIHMLRNVNSKEKSS